MEEAETSRKDHGPGPLAAHLAGSAFSFSFFIKVLFEFFLRKFEFFLGTASKRFSYCDCDLMKKKPPRNIESLPKIDKLAT